MSHTRFALGFPRHRKVFALSDAAFRLWVTAMDHAREQNRDGALEPMDLDIIPRCPARGRKRDTVVKELITNGLWDVTATGWQIHDYLTWQDSSETVNQKREQARERMRLLRANKTRTESERSSGVRANNSRSSREVRSGSDEEGGMRKTTPKPPEPPAGGGGPERVRCPVPLQIPDDVLAGLELDVGLPRKVAEANLIAWARQQSADAGDLRPGGAWVKCALAAIRGRWSDGSKRAEMRAAAEPVVEPAPGPPPKPVAAPRGYAAVLREEAAAEAAAKARREAEQGGRAP